MPEGDTIHYAANRIRPLLAGRVPDRILVPQRRHAADRWAERLAGRAVERVDAHGKHLFLTFEGDLALHSHLGMSGAWALYRRGEQWRRSRSRAWLVLELGEHEIVQFDGPTLALRSERALRHDPRLAGLGQDILGEQLDEQRVLSRLRADEPTRPVGDALLDQRTVAGIGNIWKSESCFAAAVDPWRASSETSDAELLAIIRFARERMAVSAREGFRARPRAVYRRAGEPCPRCGARVSSGAQGEQARSTYWCPGCQH